MQFGGEPEPRSDGGAASPPLSARRDAVGRDFHYDSGTRFLAVVRALVAADVSFREFVDVVSDPGFGQCRLAADGDVPIRVRRIEHAPPFA